LKETKRVVSPKPPKGEWDIGGKKLKAGGQKECQAGGYHILALK